MDKGKDLCGVPFSFVKKKKFYKKDKIWIHFKKVNLIGRGYNSGWNEEKPFEYNGPAEVVNFQKYQSTQDFYFDLRLPTCINIDSLNIEQFNDYIRINSSDIFSFEKV